MTPILFEKYANAYYRGRQREEETIDALNHQFGRYISFAFHAPDKYPKKPFTAKEDDESKHVATTDDQRLAMVRIKYGKK